MLAGSVQPVFANLGDQRAHFRTDWHRRNVRRRAHGRAALTEAEFEHSLQQDGETSSISASDSDSEAEESSAPVQRMAEVVFVSGMCPALSTEPALVCPAPAVPRTVCADLAKVSLDP